MSTPDRQRRFVSHSAAARPEADKDAAYKEVELWPHHIPRPIATLGVTTLSKIAETRAHHHRKAQLVMTLRGVVTCEVERSIWIVPPRCALWIPGALPHSLRSSGDGRLFCLFAEPDVTLQLPADCCTVTVSPLLYELLLRATALPRLYDEGGPDGRIAQVLLDELALAPVERLNFPMPANPKLQKIARAMISDPADRATVAEWGRRVGAAERTLARLLQRETGMSFGRWRQQLHILLALQHLAEGEPVQTVALELGYESSSAFITMFRKVLGKPPGRYLAERAIGS